MREALARSDGDFVLAAPARPRRAKKKTSRRSFASQIGATLKHKPGRTLALVAFIGLLGAVAANALFFQTARHPAPIFRGPVVTRPAQHATPRAPEKPAAPAPQQSAPLTPPAPIPVPPTHARADAPAKDQIGALLAGGGARAPAAAPAPAPTKPADDSARVLAAQKALMKLGYVVKPDGVLGAGTRKTIEMFEQSRKLPVTGELSARVVRELSALSGLAVP